MIDFRYHMASLMAVLIALTMGVILGAGPLQTPISEGLSGEVSRVTQEKASLKEQLAAAETGNTDRDKYIQALAEDASKQVLNGNQVALVEMPGADQGQVDNVMKSLEEAGATISDRVKLTAAWTNEANTAYRDQLSQSLAQYLNTPAPASAVSAQVLGQGLTQVLTSADAKSQSISELLTSKDLPLAQMPTFSKGKANLIVVVAAKPQPEAESEDKKDAANTVVPEAVTGFAQALAGVAKQAVIVGNTNDSSGLLTLARNNSVRVTTVDSLGTGMASASTPLALAAAKAGKVENYGVETGANQIVPPLR